MNLRFSNRARIQIDAIGDYFVSIDAELAGTEVLRRIKSTAERLLEFPEIGHDGSAAGTRELPVTGLPYVIVYEHFPKDSGDIMVLNVWHCAQNR